MKKEVARKVEKIGPLKSWTLDFSGKAVQVRADLDARNDEVCTTHLICRCEKMPSKQSLTGS